jgi:hypothetical protein
MREVRWHIVKMHSGSGGGKREFVGTTEEE